MHCFTVPPPGRDVTRYLTDSRHATDGKRYELLNHFNNDGVGRYTSDSRDELQQLLLPCPLVITCNVLILITNSVMLKIVFMNFVRRTHNSGLFTRAFCLQNISKVLDY